MSDNPTEWVVIPLGRPHPADPLAEAVVSVRRADVLAALGAKEWKCVARIWDWMGEGTGYADCTPENPHDFCHWAVKP